MTDATSLAQAIAAFRPQIQWFMVISTVASIALLGLDYPPDEASTAAWCALVARVGVVLGWWCVAFVVFPAIFITARLNDAWQAWRAPPPGPPQLAWRPPAPAGGNGGDEVSVAAHVMTPHQTPAVTET
jgi:hypothetical protein